MDPKANLNDQLYLARRIIEITDAYDVARDGEGYEEEVLEPIGRDLAPRLAELVLALDEWRRKGGYDPYSAKSRVVTLVIRDPDYENEHVEEVTGEVEVETIDIDLGSQFNGPKDFDADADWGKEWIEETRESVAHLPEDGPIRQRVDELINHLTEETE